MLAEMHVCYAGVQNLWESLLLRNGDNPDGEQNARYQGEDRRRARCRMIRTAPGIGPRRVSGLPGYQSRGSRLSYPETTKSLQNPMLMLHSGTRSSPHSALQSASDSQGIEQMCRW